MKLTNSKSVVSMSRSKGYAEVKLYDVMDLALKNGLNQATNIEDARKILFSAAQKVEDSLFEKGHSEVGELSGEKLWQILYDRFEMGPDEEWEAMGAEGPGTGKRWNDAPYSLEDYKPKPRARRKPSFPLYD